MSAAYDGINGSTPLAKQQLDDARALATAAAKALSALTINASRSLGDAKRDTGATLASNHTAAVQRAFTDTTLSHVAVGAYTPEDIADKLGLEMKPAALVRTDHPPRFEELLKVLDALERLESEELIVGEYRTLVSRTKQALEETRARFRNSQVNVDSMDHSGFHMTAAALREVVLESPEAEVHQFDRDVRKLTEQYHGIIAQQLDAYAVEARAVETASPARMRAIRPEDDEDPWEAPAASSKAIIFESAALQRYIDDDVKRRVAEIPEAEWTQYRRREVGRLVPRARRVVEEYDSHAYHDATQILNDLAALLDRKVERACNVITTTDADAARVLSTLRDGVRLMQQSGETFQQANSAHRAAVARDRQRIVEFIEREVQRDQRLREDFETLRGSSLEQLRENADAISERLQRIIALQEEVVALANDRRRVTDEALHAVATEELRRSQFEEIIVQCKAYDKILHETMQAFLLPEGYSSQLEAFGAAAEQLAQKHFTEQASALSGLRMAALREASVARPVAFLVPRLCAFRALKRLDDLNAKAGLARAMREFCTATSDPYAAQHTDTEAIITSLKGTLEVLAVEAQQTAEKNRELFETNLRPHIVAHQVTAFFVDLDELFCSLVNEDEPFVVRAPRPVLVTLPLPLSNEEESTPTAPHILRPTSGVYPHSIVERAAEVMLQSVR